MSFPGQGQACRPGRSGVSCGRMRRFLFWTGLIALAAGWGIVPVARAVRWVPLTPRELALQAGLVVHGKIEALETGRDAAGRVFTRVDIRVDEVWKGTPPGPTCRWVAGGGILGDRVEGSEAHAAYAVGEELVAFLVRNPDGDWVTVGLAQGRFQVREDPGPGGRRWVHNPFWGDDGGIRPAAGGGRLPARRPLALEELKEFVREATP